MTMDQVGAVWADVARIRLQDKSGKQLSFGSGRLIGRDLVVTARHVLETDDGQPLDDQGWEVRLIRDREGENWPGEPIPAEVVRRVPPPVDLALLKLRGGASRVPSGAFRLRLARYDQESDFADVWFAGFPDAARDKERRAREYGTPANLRWAADKALRRVRVTVAPANTPKEEVDWCGCSGGVVLFHRRDTLFVLGVLVQVPRAFSASLDAVPIVEGLADKQFCDLLSNACAFDLDDIQQLERLPRLHGDVDHTTSASPGCKELIVQILGNTFRRAFHFNFTFRFVDTHEFNEVTQSIRDCRIFLQSNMVRVLATCPKEISDIVQGMLDQVKLMEAIFQKMQPFLNTYARLDHGTPSEMMDVFTEMETVRVEFLINTKLLSEKSNVSLPPAPSAQEDKGGVMFGVDGFLNFIKRTSLEQTTVKSLADALKEWRQRMKRSEDQQ